MLPLLEHLVYIIQWQEPSWKSDQQEHYKRGGQKKGRSRIAQEPPIHVPKESLVPASAKQCRKEQAKV